MPRTGYCLKHHRMMLVSGGYVHVPAFDRWVNNYLCLFRKARPGGWVREVHRLTFRVIKI